MSRNTPPYESSDLIDLDFNDNEIELIPIEDDTEPLHDEQTEAALELLRHKAIRAAKILELNAEFARHEIEYIIKAAKHQIGEVVYIELDSKSAAKPVVQCVVHKVEPFYTNFGTVKPYYELYRDGTYFKIIYDESKFVPRPKHLIDEEKRKQIQNFKK